MADALSISLERERAETAIRESEYRYQVATSITRDAIIDFNYKTEHISYGDSYLNLLGYQPGEIDISYANHKQFYWPQDIEKIDRISQHLLSMTDDNYECTYRLLHKDGSPRWVINRCRVITRNHAGKPMRMLTVLTDITPIIEHQQSLQAAIIQAELANKTKSEFLTRMSHELRTPLNGILGSSHLLTDTPNINQKHLANINQCAQDLTHIVEQLFSFTAIEDNVQTQHKQDFSLQRLSEELHHLFRDETSRKSLELLFELAPNLPEKVNGDYNNLRQILTALLSNAIKFTDHGHVSLTIAPAVDKSDHYQFLVADTGIGIDENALDNLFTPFHQVR